MAIKAQDQLQHNPGQVGESFTNPGLYGPAPMLKSGYPQAGSPIMSEQLVNDWLESFSSSALDYDLKSHMAHIAQDVAVFGVPGFDSLDYDDWYRR